MFIDEVKIFARGGRGGDGCISFRREKFVPRGGPNGGDGGDGGNVYLKANPNINNLNYFRFHPHLIAENGAHGKGKSQRGKKGEDLIVDVPVGTVVKDPETNQIVADLNKPGQLFLAARGGSGGFGNEHFKSPTNPAPRVREFGEPGEERSYILELRMLADVGLVGFPNAGKSTLLSRITNAKPKIADYPFTTLEPMVGVVTLDETRQFVMADIPGIIEGAHQGKGLGDKFLKHISRAKLLLFLIDVMTQDLPSQYENLKRELREYSEVLAQKPELIAITKADLLPQSELQAKEQELAQLFSGREVILISAVSGYNIGRLVERLYDEVAKFEQTGKMVAQAEEVIYTFTPTKDDIQFKREGNRIIVSGSTIERLVSRIDTTYRDGQILLNRRLSKFNLNERLTEFGAKEGDIIVIGKNEFVFRKD